MTEMTFVGRVTDIAESGLLGVVVDGQRVLIVRIDDDIYAFDGLCTHGEANLDEGELFDGCLMCPIHGGEFDASTGAPITLPATEPLRRHEVHLKDGEIHVRLA